jgi:hypothetical protein
MSSAELRRLEGGRALGQRVVEAHGAGQLEGRHHLLDLAHHVVDQRALEQAQHVAHGGQHHVLGGHRMQHLLQRGAKFSMMTMALAPESLSWCSSSRGVYSGLTLTTTSPRAARPPRPPGTGHVGHHDRHAVALGQAQALQVGGQRARGSSTSA